MQITGKHTVSIKSELFFCIYVGDKKLFSHDDVEI